MKKTKIVCTLGPSTDNIDIIKSMINAGLDVARLNFSHGNHKEHLMRANLIKTARTELNKPIALLLDTKGPEIRIGEFENGMVELKTGQKFTLCCGDLTELGNTEKVSVSFKGLINCLFSGARVLISDGLIELKVLSIIENDIVCEVLNGGVLTNKKSINIPDICADIPYLSEKDKEDILFAIKNDFDYIAASFTRCADDIKLIKQFLNLNGGHDIHIIAKIENAQGVANIDDILKISDGIMVARGDMGVEINFIELPRLQKELIKKAYSAGKKVITATQMLESMIKNPRPTRAETTDVANAIYDGTSAIMLSGETAVGDYPVEVVRTMANIALSTEADIDYIKRFNLYKGSNSDISVTDAISHATCTTAHDLKASSIITVTKTGSTARMISKYRPACSIVGCTTSEKVYRQLNLSWGILPVIIPESSTTDELFDVSVEAAVNAGVVKNGNLVVITAGVPLGVSGTTNLLKVHTVGKVLVNGIGTNTGLVTGNLCVVKNEQDALMQFNEGDILVINQTSNILLPLLRKAKGLIIEQSSSQSHGVVVGLTLCIPVVYGAENSTDILKTGDTVTIDAGTGLVYSGQVTII